MKHGPSLADKVYGRLKDEIISCRLAPGSMILEGSLAERFGVSKTPVREALGYLSREGLVEVLPRVGYVVTPVTLQDLHEVYHLRLLLEMEAIDQATRRMSDEELEGLMEQAKRGTEVDGSSFIDQADLLVALHLNRDFHVRIAECSGNHRLAEMVSRLLEGNARLLFADPTLHHEHYWIFREHIDLVEVMQKRDPDLARAAMRDHVEDSQRRILETLFSGEHPPSVQKATDIR